MGGMEQENRTAVLRRIRRLVMTALFVALSYVATAALMIPVPGGGYVNPGDAVVLLGAYLLGPVYGMAAGGIGPALADLLGGYGIYAPATLVIKGLMALTAALLYRWLGKRAGATVVCGIAAESMMAAGYFLYDGFLAGNFAAGLAGLPANLGQGVFGAAAAALLLAALRKSGAGRKGFPEL